MKAEAEPVNEAGEASRDEISTHEMNKGISILDLILRTVAAAGTFGSAIAMGTTNETLTVFPQFTQVRVEYDDHPSFKFFMIANSIVCGYLALSVPLSIFHIIRTAAKKSRILLLVFDLVMLTLVTAGASSATAIVYLAHKGNTSANWFAFCQLFDSFCERISGSLIGSFAAAVTLMLVIITSAVALSRS
ncbi:hypothetical protein AB3S75_036138 [Citrus x aurantiifolia]